MEQYTKFYQTYGNGVFYNKIEMEDISDYDKSLLPPEIVDILIEEGIKSFGDGLIWTLNPQEYTDWLNEWLPFEDKSVPFARSAFGDILFIREGNIMVLNSSLAQVSLMTDDVDMFINRYLTDNWFLDTFFNKDVFSQLEQKLKSPNECFGFHPLLSLGGSRNSDSVEIYNIREYLHTLSKNNRIEFYKH